jgi:hypothetical protein
MAGEEIDQAEKRRVLANDLSVLRQQREGSTYFQHTHLEDEGGGRFSAINSATVIGTTPIPQYPELPTNLPSHHDPVPDEPPLGYAVDEMVPLETTAVSSSCGEATDSASADAPSAVLPVPVDAPRADAGPLSDKEEDDDARD